jgi:hypothetical protein
MGQHSITYGDMVPETRLRFTMVFEDGDRLDRCSHPNPSDTDEAIIAHCNKTIPERWGKVVAIADREVFTAYCLP